MAAEARKALEALMGAEAMGGIPDHMKYNDEKVCRNYLCGLCPHELFTLGNFVSDCDRKISIAQKRLDKTPEDSAKITQLTKEIENLASEISELTKEVEVLGEEGKVTESMDRLHEVDIKKGQKADKEKELKNTMEGGSPSQQQKLRVCEVCSAYLSIFDSDRRLADHFGGKMHLGYLKIRDLLKELKEKNRDQVATAVPDLRDEGRSYYDRDRDRGSYDRDRYRDHRGSSGRSEYERRHYDRRSRSKSPDRRGSGHRRRSRSPPRRRH